MTSYSKIVHNKRVRVWLVALASSKLIKENEPEENK